MPQVVGAIIKVVISAAVKIGVSKALAVAIAKFVVALAASAALSAINRLIAPKPRAMQQGEQLRTKLDPAYPREVVVGRGATGGSLVFDNTSGEKNVYRWMVIALSDCEISQVVTVYGNGQALTFSGDIHTGLRPCTSHFQDKNGSDELYMRIYKGTSSQTADPDLLAAFPGILDSNFRGRGVAYAIIRMEYDTDAYANGAEFVFVIDGALCYDPRSATTAFTNNAALIARQYLEGFKNNGIRVAGLGCDAADLPDAEWEDAADICDEAVSLAAGGTEARYRAGGVISALETPREVLGHLCAAMAAKHVDRGGEVVVLPGVARSPVLDFVEADLLADEAFTYDDRLTADERVNCIASTFVNPAENYQESALPPRKDTAAITADGGDRYPASNAYRFVYSKTQGQRLDEIELRGARKEGRLSFAAPLWAFQLEPGDWVTSTNPRWGNVSKTWEVLAVELLISPTSGQARCGLQLRETATSVFSWTTGDEINNAAAVPTRPTLIPSVFDGDGRIRTWLGLPINSIGGVALTRSVSAPLSSSSSTSISVAAHDVYGPDVTYNLPSATITGLSADTLYYVFYDRDGAAYVATSSSFTASSYYIHPSRYIAVGNQRTQTGGGGYTPPPPPPPGGGGGGWSGGGGVLV